MTDWISELNFWTRTTMSFPALVPVSPSQPPLSLFFKVVKTKSNSLFN